MITSLKGTQDILPQESKAWQDIENISRKAFAVYGYGEIRTPIIEETALFARSVGKETDIVSKQMYSFKDQGGREISLRPEETASVVRAYIERCLDKTESFVKLFYIGPMFRCEKPQAGRFRQFHQIGVEAIGSYSPYLDAEIIVLLDNLLTGYGLKNYKFKINSLGCEKDKQDFKRLLSERLKKDFDDLCDDCKKRYKSNILRVLDCKNRSCCKIVESLSLANPLCEDCEKDFKVLQSALRKSCVNFEVTKTLVRGLDYYTKTVFEATTDALGAQDALAAGGRYDNLVEELGGPKRGACGFAIGVERVADLLKKMNPADSADRINDTTFIITMGEAAYRQGYEILFRLRKAGIASDIDYQQRSLKAQMRYADKIKAKYVVIIGEDELKQGAVLVKDMRDGQQRSVTFNELVAALK